MPLDSIVKVDISTQTAPVARRSFSIPLIAVHHTNWGERTRLYDITNGLGGLEADGFSEGSPVHEIAKVISMQNPSPRQVMVGRLNEATQYEYEFLAGFASNTTYYLEIGDVLYQVDSAEDVPLDDLANYISGDLYNVAQEPYYDVGAIVVNSFGRVWRLFERGGAGHNEGNVEILGEHAEKGDIVIDEDGDDYDKWICLGIDPGATATENDGVLTVTLPSYLPVRFWTSHPTLDLWHFTDVSMTPALQASLTAITEFNDDWYMLMIGSRSYPDVLAAASWTESRRKKFVSTVHDTDVLKNEHGNIARTLRDLSYVRTTLSWHADLSMRVSEAIGGYSLTQEPGSITWKFKTLPGIAPAILTPNQQALLKEQNVNYYLNVGGLNIFLEGITCGGEWSDLIPAVDMLHARLQERIFLQLANQPKVPFTVHGLSLIESEIRAVLQRAVDTELLVDGGFTITLPVLADVDPNDKRQRILRPIKFNAIVAQAIHSLELEGVVTV